MKNKFKSFSFWTALAGAVVMLVNALGQAFGFSVNERIVSDIIMSIAGVLVVFGIVSMPSTSDEKSDENNDPKSEEDSNPKNDEEGGGNLSDDDNKKQDSDKMEKQENDEKENSQD